MWFKQAILDQKAFLAELLEEPMAALAETCAPLWSVPDALDQIFSERLKDIPYCHLLYALSTNGTQISSNVSTDEIDPRWRGQELSQRPFQTGNLPYRGFIISPIYVSRVSHKRCITLIQAVIWDHKLSGFIAADFNLEDLPQQERADRSGSAWTQYKGDPAIRRTVFEQQRMKSLLDENIDAVIDNIDILMREHGIYHFILHFSSSRAIFWVFDDPYNYHFHGISEILDPEVCLAYPIRPYPENAKVSPEKIRMVLEQFKSLRLDDENIYLRSGSLNIMNGIIGLTFSCDGSHYLTVDEFLNKEHPFWV